MSSSKKAIQINPEYFSLKKNRSMKKQPRDKKPKNKTGKQQKKELLKRLKEIQDSKQKITVQEPIPNDDIVKSSIDFLNTLSKEKETEKPAITQKPVIAEKPVIKQNNEPPYSNLKGSKKPSYREWLQSQDQKITIENNDVTKEVKDTLREEKLKALQKKIKKPQKYRKHHKTIKITETFGKRNGKISVHIKNKEEKDKLEQEKKTLKKHTIPKIKAYLKQHNLLKIGSYAPNDVLREMYEAAVVSGNINNNNKDILVHNFLEN